MMPVAQGVDGSDASPDERMAPRSGRVADLPCVAPVAGHVPGLDREGHRVALGQLEVGAGRGREALERLPAAGADAIADAIARDAGCRVGGGIGDLPAMLRPPGAPASARSIDRADRVQDGLAGCDRRVARARSRGPGRRPGGCRWSGRASTTCSRTPCASRSTSCRCSTAASWSPCGRPASQVVLTVTYRESVGFGLTLTLRTLGGAKVAEIVSQ